MNIRKKQTANGVNKIILILLILIIFTPFIYINATHPHSPINTNPEGETNNSAIINTNPEGETNQSKLPDPLKVQNIETLIGRVIKSTLGIVGSLALLLFVYGGLVLMTAGGNDQQVKKGKDVLVYTTIGLLVIFSSYAILTLVFKTLDPSH